MALSLKIKIRSGYLFAFLMLLVSYFLIFHIIGKLAREAKWVSHSYNVINKLETIKSEITDAETGVRGYIITKDSRFLKPYTTGSRNVDSIFHELSDLMKDNKESRQELEVLGNLLTRRLNFLSNAVRILEQNDLQVSDSIRVNREPSKRAMDSIRLYVRQLQLKEYNIMQERKNTLDGFFTSTKVIAITSLVIALITVLYSVMVYNRENRQKEKSEEQARNYSLQLEERVIELNKVNLELEDLKSIEKFAATGRIARTMAHEVRNPLTNIALASEQLKEIMAENEESEVLLEMIGRNVNRINQLVSDLLHSTRFAQLDYTAISVNELLEETLEAASDRIGLSGVIIEKYFENDICEVYADREKIKLAFLNIIVNAIEAMDKDTKVLQIRTRKQGDKCAIEFRDNGTGMDEETIQKLFEPYFTGKLKGNGLGLTNTQNIILNHKGTITVRSKVGQGSTFIITLNTGVAVRPANGE